MRLVGEHPEHADGLAFEQQRRRQQGMQGVIVRQVDDIGVVRALHIVKLDLSLGMQDGGEETVVERQGAARRGREAGRSGRGGRQARN